MSTLHQDDQDFSSLLQLVTEHITSRQTSISDLPILPSASAYSKALASLPKDLPTSGLGTKATTDLLINSILPGCLQAQTGPRYFGFVTGGVTPAAQMADILAGSYDENVQVTLPDVTAATAIENRTLDLVLDLLGVQPCAFQSKTLTTGATASNVLGLACARDYLYSHSPFLPQGYSYAQDGPPCGLNIPSPPMVILALHPHFSITKSAALVGIGGGPRVIQSMPASPDDELAFDLLALETRLYEEKKVGRGVIVSYGLGEVNTGAFGGGLEEVSNLCKRYGAWLHVDAAFGGFAAVLPEFRHLTKGLDQVDSLTLDGHKWLNVPYDCGLFYAKSPSALTAVFAPPNPPAYLTVNTRDPGIVDESLTGVIDHAGVTSPLYLGIENSRRFRALALFASLMSLGKDGYQDLIRRNIQFARRVAEYIDTSGSFVLMNPSPGCIQQDAGGNESIPIVPLNIVLFSGSETSAYPPSDPTSSARLTAAINGTGKMYVSATRWRGQGAVRVAVSNWMTGLDGTDSDLDIVKAVLKSTL